MDKKDKVKGREGRSAPLGGEGSAACFPIRHRKNGCKYTRPHSYETRLRAVRLYLEEGMPGDVVAQEIGVTTGTIFDWVRTYREGGEEGLRPRGYGQRTANAPDVVKTKIAALKKDNPSFGVKRISQLLRRVFMLRASPETVRRTLQKEHLISPLKKKSKRNPPKPRFFERSTPNQMWQSDIFTFRLAGKNAYLIGFLDDYSRYMVGVGLFRSQTVENLLEVYRRAASEYGLPRELLTDNGRQYAAWRGKTRFQMELQKDRVHHIRSAPHHPMTLGKIERFWKTIWEEFLSRAQYETFESAQERVKYWVRYYNHKRPNQGIGGLCPADRFFEIQNQLRQVIEKGIEENALELALRGKPRSPFYMVGRLGEQSVVIQAEKGKVRMLVDGKEANKEMVYEIAGEKDEHKGSGEKGTEGLQCAREVASGAVVVDANPQIGGDMPGDGDLLDPAEQLATGCNEGDAGKFNTSQGAGREAASHAEAVEGVLGTADGEAGREALAARAEVNEDSGVYAGRLRVQAGDAERGGGNGKGVDESGSGRMCARGTLESRVDHPGAERAFDCPGSGASAGGEPEDLLQVGEEGAFGDDGRPCDPVFRSSRDGGGRGEGEIESEDGGTGAGGATAGTKAPYSGSAEPAVV